MAEQEREIRINAQYVKDQSFENPRAPASLAPGDRPDMDVSVDVKARKLQDEVYEVLLSLSARADRDGEAMFIAELAYGGVFTLKGVQEEELEPALLIFCPGLLFPYARRVMSDMTRDGGFPPLMLDPIDFAALYAQRKAEGNQAAEQDEAPAAEA